MGKAVLERKCKECDFYIASIVTWLKATEFVKEKLIVILNNITYFAIMGGINGKIMQVFTT